MHSRIFVAFALAATVLVAEAPPLAGQDWKGKARIDGRVVNEKGEPIVGAKLSLRKGGVGPDIVTDKKGRWAYLGLGNGEWSIDVAAPGYLVEKTSVQLSELYRLPPMVIRLERAPEAAPPPQAVVPRDTSAEVIASVERGNQLLEQKNYAAARTEYEKALAAVPDNPVILRGIAQTWYGEKKIDEAIATLKRVVELDPADAAGPLLLASLLLEKGNLEEAKTVLARLPPESIKDPAVYVNFGVLLLNQKRPAEAWGYFDQAVRIAPSDADSYFYRGLTALQLKKKAEAKADLEKYLELAPTGDQAPDAKELLKSVK
jgi:tetratricopeptide (TPR) repeat protein